MREHSDGTNIYICRGCMKQAIYNAKRNIHKCNRCGDMADIVEVPSTWSSNVLFNEI